MLIYFPLHINKLLTAPDNFGFTFIALGWDFLLSPRSGFLLFSLYQLIYCFPEPPSFHLAVPSLCWSVRVRAHVTVGVLLYVCICSASYHSHTRPVSPSKASTVARLALRQTASCPALPIGPFKSCATAKTALFRIVNPLPW